MKSHYTTDDSMSARDWFILVLAVLIPALNLVCLFYWSFGRYVKPQQRAFSRAMLTVILVCITYAIFFL